LGSAGGLGGGGGAGGGGGKGGFSKITFFGLNTGGKQGNLLQATFYDLKQTKDHKPTQINFWAEAKKFVTDNNWNPSTLSTFYRAPDPLFAPRLYVPVDKSEEAPKAFGVEKDVQPNKWIVHYKGRFRARKEGTFRFIGCGDNLLVVRLNNNNIFDGSYDNAQGGKIDPKLSSFNNSPPEKLGTVCAGGWQLAAGQWFHASLGETFDIEIVIGDCGGFFSAFLFFEEKGATYAKRKDGSGLAYPMFELDGSPMPKITTPKELEKFNPPVVHNSGIFEGVPSGR
ncbi:MAG: hypothetical protein WCH98_06100, partial [Verrucomicrobiota bacterium]